MRKQWIIAALALLLSLTVVPSVRAQDQGPVVRGYLFYSRTCPSCHEVRARVLPKLYRERGQQLQIMAVEVSTDEANYQWLLACEEQYGVAPDEAAVPVVFVGDRYLIGTSAIENGLPSLIDRYLNAGGVDYPDVPRPGGPLEPTVWFMFFFSPSCPHCQTVRRELFPRIEAIYGDSVQWESYDTTEETNYRALLALGELASLDPERRGKVPLIAIGDEFSLHTLLTGGGEIQEYLEPAIQWYLAIGGTGLPAWKDQLFDVGSTPQIPTASAPAPTGTPPAGGASPIHLAYFAEAGCDECNRVSIALEHLEAGFPSLVIHEFDIIDDVALNLCLSEALDVPGEQRHDAPAVFVGSDYLVGKDVQYDALVQIVSQYTSTGAEPVWEECDREQVELPSLPPWWLVVSSGLLDGINPCAFATIIFFVSYLSMIERRGRDIILVGISFTLAVFLSYLGFGMVLREVLSGLIDVVGQTLRTILNVLVAVACLALAAVSLSDFRKARRGRPTDMALRLPDRLRKWINASIRRTMRAEALVAASFVSGVVISFIELTCTGQVYVPIILGLSNPEHRAQAVLALVVYCLAFVIPLIIVFVVSYLGTSSRKLGVLLSRHIASVKLATAMLFLGIGLWLLYYTLGRGAGIASLFSATGF